jgi:hypothetical protein
LASPMLCGIFGTPSRTRIGGAFSLVRPSGTATTLALAFRVFVALAASVLFTRVVYHTRKVRKGLGYLPAIVSATRTQVGVSRVNSATLDFWLMNEPRNSRQTL